MELPPNAKRVFKGVIYEVWQWEQEMFDGSTATFERIKRPDTVNVIAALDGKILIQEQIQPGWKGHLITLPGGRADHGATPVEEAKRELLEETGYVSDDWMLWKTRQFHGVIFTAHTFVARNCKKIKETEFDSGEKIENKLIGFEDFLLLPDHPKFRDSEVALELLRVRLHPEEKEKLYKLLFP